MTSTKINSTDHPTEAQNFQLSLPMKGEYFIGADESIKTLTEISERLDDSKLNAVYERLPKSSEATPKDWWNVFIQRED